MRCQIRLRVLVYIVNRNNWAIGCDRALLFRCQQTKDSPVVRTNYRNCVVAIYFMGSLGGDVRNELGFPLPYLNNPG
jgi:hypothetical protein